MMDAAMQLAGVTASLVILVRAETALNRMTPLTRLPVRLAMVLLVIGALAQMGAIAFGQVPEPVSLLLLCGVALLLVCERRLQVLVPGMRRHPARNP